MGYVFIAGGLFSLLGAIFNWNWFMNHRKAKNLSAILTPTGTRIFYGILGIAVMSFGILIATGILKGE